MLSRRVVPTIITLLVAATAMAQGDLFQTAYDLFEDGRYEKSVEVYTLYLEEHPASSNALYNRGLAFSNLGDHERALMDFVQSFQLDSSDHDAMHRIGVEMRHLGRFESALSMQDQVIERAPDFKDAYTERGIVLDDLGRFEEALASYERALDIDPGSRTDLYNRGLTLDHMGRSEEALASVQAAIDRGPSALYYWGKGDILANMEAYDAAVAAYDSAIALDPDRIDLYYNRGIALYNGDRPLEAIDDFQYMLGFDPDDADAMWYLALCNADLGDHRRAVYHYERTEALDPDYAYLSSVDITEWRARAGLSEGESPNDSEWSTTAVSDSAQTMLADEQPDGEDVWSALKRWWWIILAVPAGLLGLMVGVGLIAARRNARS